MRGPRVIAGLGASPAFSLFHGDRIRSCDECGKINSGQKKTRGARKERLKMFYGEYNWCRRKTDQSYLGPAGDVFRI